MAPEGRTGGDPRSTSGRLVVVSNRLPVAFQQDDNGDWQAKSTYGGLVSALLPVLRNRGGQWIGWSGVVDADAAALEQLTQRVADEAGYALRTVSLSAEERDQFYHGFCNEVLWPLFHDMQTPCNFAPEYWKAYQRANRKFARTIAANHEQGDFIWVQDYHLMETARVLRRMGVRSRIAFFLHIPFPPLDIFLKLPWRFEILRGLMEFDLIGFQSHRDRRNFLQCMQTLVGDIRIGCDGPVIPIQISKAADDRFGRMDGTGRDSILVGSFPISIDFNAYAALAERSEIRDRAARLKADLGGRQLLLGVERLDYTKGLLLKLEAFRLALRRYPELRRQVTLVQHIAPSREDIQRYHDLKLDIERLVSEINGEFTESGWVPVHYIHRSLGPDDLSAYYLAADIALVTPVKDGMNLVAKEYCAACIDNAGVLILSEFAGAAAQLREHALLVNPFDVVGTARRIHEACTMPAEERMRRMAGLRDQVRRHDVFEWVDSFLSAAIGKDLSHFPVIEEYVPSPKFETSE